MQGERGFFEKKPGKKLHLIFRRMGLVPLRRKIDKSSLRSFLSRKRHFLCKTSNRKTKNVLDSGQNENENDDTHLSGIGTLSEEIVLSDRLPGVTEPVSQPLLISFIYFFGNIIPHFCCICKGNATKSVLFIVVKRFL